MSSCEIRPARTPVTFRTTTARDLRNRLRVVINHLVERPDYLRLLLHLLFELIQAFEDRLDVNIHLVDVFPMTISPHVDPVDFVVVGLQDATNLLKGRRRIRLQLVSVRATLTLDSQCLK